MLKKKSTKIVLGIVGVLVLATAAFVGRNFWLDRNTVNIEQANAPSFEDVVQTQQEQVDPNEQNAAEDSNVATSLTGEFSGSAPYDVSGSMSIVEVDGEQVLVFDESFRSSNGPDLLVYLSENAVQSGEPLGEFVSLQELKSTSGGQTYSLPENIDDFQSVVIWCRAFAAQFGAADFR